VLLEPKHRNPPHSSFRSAIFNGGCGALAPPTTNLVLRLPFNDYFFLGAFLAELAMLAFMAHTIGDNYEPSWLVRLFYALTSQTHRQGFVISCSIGVIVTTIIPIIEYFNTFEFSYNFKVRNSGELKRNSRRLSNRSKSL
jgi:hypothetical protein